MLVGIARRFQQTHLETAEATPSTLRLLLHPRHLATPSLMVIIGIYNLQPQGTGIAGTFIFPYVILFKRIDIRITIIDSRAYAMIQQTFDNGR